MNLSRLETRLAKLEARRQATEEPYRLPDVPDDFGDQVFQILWKYGCFASVEEMVREVLGATDPATVAAMVRVVEEVTGDRSQEDVPASEF